MAASQTLIFFASILCGIFGAVLGLGGGMFIVPILTLFFGINIKYAIGASIISVIATSSGAAAGHLQDHFTNVRLGILLAVAASIGTWMGVQLSSSVDTRHIFLIFSVMLFFSALLMLQPKKTKLEAQATPSSIASLDFLDPFADPLANKMLLNSSYFDSHLNQFIKYSVSNVILGLTLMMGIGVLTGLLGIGCGALRVPAMDRAMRVPMKVSSATSNFIIGITSTVAAATLLMKGQILPNLVASVALGVLIGSWGGAKLLVHVPSQWIQKAFVWILLIMTVQMGYKTCSLYKEWNTNHASIKRIPSP